MKDDADHEVDIFAEALKVPRQERDAFLAHASGGDEKLRHRIEALLRAYDQLGDFLEKPPTGDPSIEAH
jgi:hypothetical protein